jgi:hypothetical protein
MTTPDAPAARPASGPAASTPSGPSSRDLVDEFRVRAPGDRLRRLRLAGRVLPGDLDPEHLHGIAVDVTYVPPGSAARPGPLRR